MRRGFTLVELLMALALLGGVLLVAAALLGGVSRAVRRAAAPSTTLRMANSSCISSSRIGVT